MGEKLTDARVKALPPPATGNRITFDGDVGGFGVRVTAAGARAFVLCYRTGGRQRRITIGAFGDWSVSAARQRAREIKREVDVGADPMGDRHAERAAPDINALADRFMAEHVAKKRAPTRRDYESLLRLYIRPALGTTKAADVTHADVERLHASVARKAPYRANRTVAVLSKMMSLAIRWRIRDDNPVRGIERAPEEKRERFLSPAEIARLMTALGTLPDRGSANAIRLLLLTGARRGETLAAKWADIDLDAGVWTKPAATTKSARLHRVPLSGPALALLRDMSGKAGGREVYLFPSATGGHLLEVRKTWAAACREAGLSGVRLHDLRHSFASVLASSGLSLPIIGALLGHTQAATTARYSHLIDSALRDATERVGKVVSGGDVLPLRGT